MDYKKLSGYGLMAVAALMTLQNVSDKWADVQAWEGALNIITPAFVAVLIKQLMPMLLGVAGGLLLPTIGPTGGWDGTEKRGTLVEKIEKVVAADVTARTPAVVTTDGPTITIEKGPPV